MSMKTEEAYQAPALAKGLEVLEFLSGQTEPYAVAELARALGRSRNEIYRMVIVLERSGYLWRTDADRFSVTRKLFDLGMRAPPQQNLLIKALPHMERFRKRRSRAVILRSPAARTSSWSRGSKAPTPWASRYGSDIAAPSTNRPPAVSFMPIKPKTYARPGARLQTSKDNRDRWAELERDISATRDKGVFLARSAYVDAVTDIAAPITIAPNDLAIGALGMPFIGGRSAKISVTQGANATKEAARRISKELI